MARYLIQGSYNNSAIAESVRNPQDQADAVHAIIENMGSHLGGFCFCFGEYTAVVSAELPDNVNAAAVAMAVRASAAISDYKTTVLLSTDEAVEAMRRTGGLGYRPPSRSG